MLGNGLENYVGGWIKSSRLSLFIVLSFTWVFSLNLPAQTPVQAIRATLAERFPVATQVTLSRDGLWMFGAESPRPLSNVYKKGAISQSFSDALVIKTTLPMNRDNPPVGLSHLGKFGDGDTLWVVSTDVRSDGVLLTLNSDPMNSVRYIATLKFVFPDKTLPTPEVVLNTLTEVMDVVPVQASAGGA